MFIGDQKGKAEEAVAFYVSVFENSEILSIERYGPGEEEPEGMVKTARFSLNGVQVRAMDSAYDHRFTITPAISLYVECESEAELVQAHARLVDGGMELMPLGDYGFSARFAWVQDRYGVSWQLNLP